MRIVLGALLVLAGAAPLGAQTGTPAAPAPPQRQITRVDPATLRQLEAARDTAWRAWFGNDRAVMERILPANFVGIGWGTGPWDDRASAFTGAEEFVKAGGRLLTLEFPHTEVQLFGNIAVVYSHYVLTFDMGGDVVRQAGRATEIFERQQGGWWSNPSWHVDSGN